MNPIRKRFFNPPKDEVSMILGLCGSPRAKATEYALREALRMLEERGLETVYWGVRGKRLSFCTHCDHCL